LIIGEPEYTSQELVSALDKGKPLKGIRGIHYKKGKTWIKNPTRPLIENLDNLPFPDLSLINLKQYKNPVCKNHPYTMVLSSRGCPHQCTYCYMEVYGHKWRARSAENVVLELIQIRRKHHVREVWFRDDLFALNKTRIMDICEGIIKNKLDITWSCQTRADTLDLEIAKKMKEAGCYLVSLGIESGSQKMLDNLKKNTTLEKIRKGVDACRVVGIRTRGFFIIGAPGDNLKTIEESFQFAKNLDLDYYTVGILTPYPETTLFNEAYKRGIIKDKSWKTALSMAGQIDTDFTF
jgi:radical SAM superfamily enzyme YgiQ (UPF0313 family)